MSRVQRTLTAILAAVTLVGCAGSGDADGGVGTAQAEPTPVDGRAAASPTPVPDPTPSDRASTDEDTSDDPPTCSVAPDEAGIEVLEPTAGATVGPSFTLRGCGNTFEATYVWEVESGDGTIMADGFGTMTCGTGCVGTFDETVEVRGTGAATLRVFEESPKDGSRVGITEIPLTIAP